MQNVTKFLKDHRAVLLTRSQGFYHLMTGIANRHYRHYLCKSRSTSAIKIVEDLYNFNRSVSSQSIMLVSFIVYDTNT